MRPVRQPIAAEIGNIHRHDFIDAGLARQPVKRRVRQVHFTLTVGIAAHPSYDVTQMVGIKGIDLRPAKLDPLQQFISVRRIKQIGSLDNAGPCRYQPHAPTGEFPQQRIESYMMQIIGCKQRDLRPRIKKNVSHATLLSALHQSPSKRWTGASALHCEPG